MANDSQQGERGLSQGADVSDLIGVKLTLGLALWFLVVLACFFFIGPVVGIVAILAGVVIGAILAVRAIRRADTSG
ncbi:MAG: hypothetical protein WB771_13375 [Solirubrobacterales bacterium]